MENLSQQRVSLFVASLLQDSALLTARWLRFLEPAVLLLDIEADLLPDDYQEPDTPRFQGGFLVGSIHQLTTYTGQIQAVQEVIVRGDVAYQNLCDYVRLLNEQFACDDDTKLQLELKVEDRFAGTELRPHVDPAHRLRVVHLTFTSEWQLGQVGLFFEDAAHLALRNQALKEHFHIEDTSEEPT